MRVARLRSPPQFRFPVRLGLTCAMLGLAGGAGLVGADAVAVDLNHIAVVGEVVGSSGQPPRLIAGPGSPSRSDDSSDLHTRFRHGRQSIEQSTA